MRGFGNGEERESKGEVQKSRKEDEAEENITEMGEGERE